MIHLDTHVLVWIVAGQHERLPPALRRRLPGLSARFSPMAALELQYLFESGRIAEPGHSVIASLSARLDLRPSEVSFPRLAAIAAELAWTRDPFDRLIAACAMADDAPLLTADRALLAHCPVATWHDWR